MENTVQKEKKYAKGSGLWKPADTPTRVLLGL
jgi:hypothetical protein